MRPSIKRKVKYGARFTDVENASFKTVVFASTDVALLSATHVMKQIATRLNKKKKVETLASSTTSEPKFVLPF